MRNDVELDKKISSLLTEKMKEKIEKQNVSVLSAAQDSEENIEHHVRRNMMYILVDAFAIENKVFKKFKHSLREGITELYLLLINKVLMDKDTVFYLEDHFTSISVFFKLLSTVSIARENLAKRQLLNSIIPSPIQLWTHNIAKRSFYGLILGHASSITSNNAMSGLLTSDVVEKLAEYPYIKLLNALRKSEVITTHTKADRMSAICINGYSFSQFSSPLFLYLTEQINSAMLTCLQQNTSSQIESSDVLDTLEKPNTNISKTLVVITMNQDKRYDIKFYLSGDVDADSTENTINLSDILADKDKNLSTFLMKISSSNVENTNSINRNYDTQYQKIELEL